MTDAVSRMKIIDCGALSEGYRPNERLVAENIADQDYASAMCTVLSLYYPDRRFKIEGAEYQLFSHVPTGPT